MATVKGPSKSPSRNKYLQGWKTVSEAAKAWGVTQTYVYQMIRDSRIKFRHFAGVRQVTGKLPKRKRGNQYKHAAKKAA